MPKSITPLPPRPPGAPKRGMGRPKIEPDIKQVENLAAIGATIGEMATVLGVSMDTLERRFADTPGYAEARERGANKMKVTLRRTQVQLALRGDKTMLVWLGKVMLGQHPVYLVSTPDGQPMKVEHTSNTVSPLTAEDMKDVLCVLREAGLLAENATTTAGGDSEPPKSNGHDKGQVH